MDTILVTGITPLDEYPKCAYENYCKQCMESDTLCIPTQKPDVESINELKVNIKIENHKVINTILGPKIIIRGVKYIKIIYTADNSIQSVHSAHWEIPFCQFILLENLTYDRCLKNIDNVYTGIEHACVKCFEKRYVDISILYIMCPQIEGNRNNYCKSESYESCKPNYSCLGNRYLRDNY